MAISSRLINEQDVLPSYPGYALGSVISRADFHLPILFKKLQEKEEQLSKLTKEKQKKIESTQYTDASKDEQQRILTNENEKINREKFISSQIFSAIKEMNSSQGVFSVNEMLPIDFSRSKIRIENRASLSENFDELIIVDNTNLESKIENFVLSLQIKDAPTPVISSSIIEQLSNRISKSLSSNVEIHLIGSVATLSRVKSLEPIILRESCSLSDEMIKSAESSYILAEAVLGAFFLGYDQKVIGSDESRASSESKITFCSFISQGAIPKMKQLNLWDAYSSWKEQIETDDRAGYPIGFKVRMLSDVLKENEML